MGLESVELVLALEEEFNCEFSDRQVRMIRTVADARALACWHLSGHGSFCARQSAFYRLRRHLVALGTPRSEIGLGNSVEYVLWADDPVSQYERLQESLQRRLPFIYVDETAVAALVPWVGLEPPREFVGEDEILERVIRVTRDVLKIEEIKPTDSFIDDLGIS